jgi:hypothetical protein
MIRIRDCNPDTTVDKEEKIHFVIKNDTVEIRPERKCLSVVGMDQRTADIEEQLCLQIYVI